MFNVSSCFSKFIVVAFSKSLKALFAVGDSCATSNNNPKDKLLSSLRIISSNSRCALPLSLRINKSSSFCAVFVITESAPKACSICGVTLCLSNFLISPPNSFANALIAACCSALTLAFSKSCAACIFCPFR